MTLLAEAFTSYLGPLLKKHEAGKCIIYEDLEAAYNSTKEVLKSRDNFFVSKRVDDMHKTQVQAYREAATKALREWAQTSVPLQPMEENDTEQKFVERCVGALKKAGGGGGGTLKSRPNWKLDSAVTIVTIEIRKRAKAVFAKYHPPEEDEDDDEEGAITTSNTDDGEEGEEGEEESGEDGEEDGEMDEDGEVENTNNNNNAAAKSSDPPGTKPKGGKQAGKKNANNNNKGKNTPKKKGTNAKAGNPGARAQSRKGGAANRGRRTARGGKSNN